MRSIETHYVPAKNILEKYGIKSDKFKERFKSLLNDMNEFIKVSMLENKAYVSASVLANMLVDYFIDVARLKAFHPIEHLNSIKIVSYTSYWILKSKPIQASAQEKELIDINEKFVLLYICDFLSGSKKGNLLERNEKSLMGFIQQLLYFLRYRIHSPNSLEMMLMAFFAGQVYQDPSMDNDLPPNDD